MAKMSELYESEKFGLFMKELRESYGWSRTYLAKELGFNSESSVMNFEIGHTQMRLRVISRFCQLTPNHLTVPILLSMFEASSLLPPCKCPCHYDMGNVIPNIYNEDGVCSLCQHGDEDCRVINGLWFYKG